MLAGRRSTVVATVPGSKHCRLGRLSRAKRRPVPTLSACLTTASNSQSAVQRSVTNEARQEKTISVGLQRFCKVLRDAAVAGLAAALLLTSTPSLAVADTIQPAPAVPITSKQQVYRILREVWGHVDQLFMDSTYNGLNWQQVYQESFEEVSDASDAKDAYAVIPKMLARLGDHYTRLVPAKNSSAFKDDTTGQVVHVGCQVEAAKDGKSLFVSYVAPNSPASRAGVVEGDHVLQMNNTTPVTGAMQKSARRALRQEVMMVLQHANLQYPVINGIVQHFVVQLVPEPLELYPVQTHVLTSPDGLRTGYLAVTSFGQGTAKDFARAVHSLHHQGVTSLVMDLRSNPGGIVSSGLEIAGMLLDPSDVFCYIKDNSNKDDPILVAANHTTAKEPLVVLVNGGTASTSEILSSTLQDHHRAVIMGEHTFGKGRTQRVIPVSDGAMLLVSNTIVTSPNHHKFDQVGLEPDVACHPPATPAPELNLTAQTNSEQLAKVVEDDNCVQMAQQFLAKQVQSHTDTA